MGIFESIIDAAQVVIFFCPRGKVPVNRSQVGNRKDIPSFFYVYLYIGNKSPEFLQRNDYLIEQMGIDNLFTGPLKRFYKIRKKDRIPSFKRKLPFYDIRLGLAVSTYKNLPDDKGMT